MAAAAEGVAETEATEEEEVVVTAVMAVDTVEAPATVVVEVVIEDDPLPGVLHLRTTVAVEAVLEEIIVQDLGLILLVSQFFCNPHTTVTSD